MTQLGIQPGLEVADHRGELEGGVGRQPGVHLAQDEIDEALVRPVTGNDRGQQTAPPRSAAAELVVPRRR